MESKVLRESNLLKTTEAAIVANVDVHHVNKLIDEGILPGELFVLNHARRVLLGGCVAINFYINTADILDASARRYAIRFLMPRLRDLWAFDIDGSSPEDWSVHRKFVTIDFGDVVADTRTRLDVLERAREAVTSDPEILGGTLVLKGTRVPVYGVAAMLLSGIPHEEILEDYPSLDKLKLELAAIYAKANPQRGRPSERMKVPAGSKLEAYKTFPRRKAG